MKARSVAKARLQPQFDALEQQERSTSLGMWLFLATEALFFGGLFTAYAVYRLLYPEVFAAGSGHLDLKLGTLNTGLLLASSYLVALGAIGSEREGAARRSRLCLAGAALLGVGFLGIKGIEWSHTVGEGYFPSEEQGKSALYYSLYFGMTGLHALHVAIGVAVLAWLAFWAGAGGEERRFDVNRSTVELAGLYWHFVDIVWLFLFPLLYLVERGAS